jgi:hypothetical protein
MRNILIVLLLGVSLAVLPGCPASIQANLDKMTVVTPPAPLVEKNRQWVQDKANFKCPPSSTYAYVLAEVNLASNETRAGIRCR